jgi:hypothetical protein
MRALLLLALVGATPAPIHGVALPPSTGLRLLVSDQRPFVLDVDSGKVTRVKGLPPGSGMPVWVTSVGGRAAVVQDDKLYSVRGVKATPLRIPVPRTRYEGVIAETGTKRVFYRASDGRITLFDTRTRERHELEWPGVLSGLAEVAARGRYVAVAGGNPAWRGGPEQLMDVWLLDTQTAALTQLPGMPVVVALKRTSIAWTNDGRLVLLGEWNGRDFVAVWRPGEAELAVKTVRLPVRDGGSDSFAPLG